MKYRSVINKKKEGLNMPEVQNVGTADYAQYQPSQYPAENYAEDYSMQPEVYDENAAQMRAASKSRKGAMALSAIVIAGLALWGGHKWGKKSANQDIEKAQKAMENYAKAQKAMEEAEKAAEAGNNQFIGGNHCGNKLLAKIKELFKPFKQVVEDTKDEVKEGTEKAADGAKDAIDELKDKANDAVK